MPYLEDRGARVVLIEKGPKATRGGNSRFTYGDFRIITPGTREIRDLLDPSGMPKRPTAKSPRWMHSNADWARPGSCAANAASAESART